MLDNLYKERKYIRARIRIDKIKKFHTEVITYILIVGILAGLNYYLNKWEYPWFLWVGLGFSIKLFFKAVQAYEWSIFK